jgi:hypothetical protein
LYVVRETSAPLHKKPTLRHYGCIPSERKHNSRRTDRQNRHCKRPRKIRHNTILAEQKASIRIFSLDQIRLSYQGGLLLWKK